jgi:multidrug efflux system membrane fusion protein
VQEQQLSQAQTALSALATLTAQRAGAVAAVDLAALELSYCKVIAPFPGRVISLNISVGAYASAGIPVFLSAGHAEVVCDGEFSRRRSCATSGRDTRVDVYLSAMPTRHFAGKVQGIGWAVQPTDAIDIPHGLPLVRRELNWVHYRATVSRAH